MAEIQIKPRKDHLRLFESQTKKWLFETNCCLVINNGYVLKN